MEHLSQVPLALEDLLAETLDPGCGALVVFGGTVRDHNHGRDVSNIDYRAHAPLADKTLAAIEAETVAQYDIAACRLIHRTGTLAVGDVSVYAVVRAAHRGEAFDAARWAVDALKHRVAVWKHEHYTDGGSAWLEGCSLVETSEAETTSEGVPESS